MSKIHHDLFIILGVIVGTYMARETLRQYVLQKSTKGPRRAVLSIFSKILKMGMWAGIMTIFTSLPLMLRFKDTHPSAMMGVVIICSMFSVALWFLSAKKKSHPSKETQKLAFQLDRPVETVEIWFNLFAGTLLTLIVGYAAYKSIATQSLMVGFYINLSGPLLTALVFLLPWVGMGILYVLLSIPIKK